MEGEESETGEAAREFVVIGREEIAVMCPAS
jgi:hypothetical protein